MREGDEAPTSGTRRLRAMNLLRFFRAVDGGKLEWMVKQVKRRSTCRSHEARGESNVVASDVKSESYRFSSSNP